MLDKTPGLVPYYDVYGPDRFAKKRRRLQQIAKQFDLPIIKIGHTVLIDPEAADNRLRELALRRDRPQHRRGRPRAIDSL